MRVRHPLALVVSVATAVSATCLLVLGVATPAFATPSLVAAVATGPVCQISSPASIAGGVWTYSTGAICTSNVADMVFYEELDRNGVKVDSKLKGLTGVARSSDAITSSYACSPCTGTWVVKWGQILKAPANTMFVNPSAGCIVLIQGQYQLCVQIKTIVL